MRIAYIGNFGPPHSTENHVATALEYNGHTVTLWQENMPHLWANLVSAQSDWDALDFILWTRTGWDWEAYGSSNELIDKLQRKFLLKAARAKIPVVGFHLDIWWGLNREPQIYTEPFFDVDLLITADGGHDQCWNDAGVNHYWMPPAVSLPETELGTYRDELHSPIAFVGSWQGHYHEESKHRHELVSWLQQNYRRDCVFWPKPGEPAVRGAALRDLYASVSVVVGDSCFVGTGLANYWSDRIPETIGRGGFLLHPDVPGLQEQFEYHVTTWPAFDWHVLGNTLTNVLDMPANDRQEIAMQGRDFVRKNHTYERRMEQLVELLNERKMITIKRTRVKK